jgi:adhesin transport system membrane fusion protein
LWDKTIPVVGSLAGGYSTHYKVRIIVDRENLTSRQARIEIRPGMQAQAELQTGAKSVLQYLLKPLYKSKDALRER